MADFDPEAAADVRRPLFLVDTRAERVNKKDMQRKNFVHLLRVSRLRLFLPRADILRLPWLSVPLLLAIASQPLRCAPAVEPPPDRLRLARIVPKSIRTDRAADFACLAKPVREAVAGRAQIVCTTESLFDGYAIDDRSLPLEGLRSLGEPIPGDSFYQRLQQLTDDATTLFVHPDEPLATAPSDVIAQQVLLDDESNLDDQENGTADNSSGVFFCDLQPAEGKRRAIALSQALSHPLLANRQSKAELRSYVTRRIPAVEFPATQQAWLESATRLRAEVLETVVFQGEASHWREAEVRVEWFDTLEGGDGYRIKKFRYEALPGFWIPALLYEPVQLSAKMPIVINPNGHHRGGKAMPYKQRRCINLARRGILAYNLEFIDMGQLRDRGNKHNRLVQLDLCGTSGVAPFYLALQRGLEVALSHPHADPHRVGVAGLSGGGWQSILLAALDTRITLANPVAGYCSLLDRVERDNNIGDAEQIPTDLCGIADYTHLTAMVAPRPLLLTYNAQDDCCFLPELVLEDLERVGRDAYGLCGAADHFQTYINRDPGTHNFDRDNREAFYRWVYRHWSPLATGHQTIDLLVDDSEIRTGEELAVPLPTENLTLHELALSISRSLPSGAAHSPREPAAATDLAPRRKLLREILRQPVYVAKAELAKQELQDGVAISHWRLQLGDDWTLPAVEFRPRDARETCLVVSDRGKQSLAAEIEPLLAAGKRVIVVDLLGFGEADPGSDPGSQDDVALMLIATIGQRPLGIQVAQLSAVARWATAEAADHSPSVNAVGPRNSMIGLLAAASDPTVVSAIRLRQAWRSLRDIIAEDLMAEQAPEQFCFGLLKHFEVQQLVELASPATVVFGNH